MSEDQKVTWGAMIAARIHPNHRDAIESIIESLICPHDCAEGECNLVSFGSIEGDNETVIKWLCGEDAK